MNAMGGVVSCWRCGKRYRATGTDCPNCGAANVWEPEDLDPPAQEKGFVLGALAGVLAAVLVAALLVFLWVVWTVAAQ